VISIGMFTNPRIKEQGILTRMEVSSNARTKKTTGTKAEDSESGESCFCG